MKILIYSLNFSPELTGIGKYTGEMASWLAARGHDVRVITAPPYYPAWAVAAPYRWFRYASEDLNGVRVYRCPLWVPSKPNALRRVAHLASFSLSSFPRLLMQWNWRPHVIWLVEPPLMCAPGALAVGWLSRAKVWLHIQDYEVDAAFDLGVLKNAKLKSIIVSVERFLMQRFDRVSTISEKMAHRALRKGVKQSRISLFRNWVNISGIFPLPRASSYRELLGIPDGAVVALYSGNMGKKQGLEILAEVAQSLVGMDSLHFIFCGGGPGKADLVSACIGLLNVHFLDLQPIEMLNELLGVADIHLMPQLPNAADLVMPSKLTGMFASGRAVLATADKNTELGLVVGECGLLAAPGDAADFAARIVELARDPQRRSVLGAKGRAYAERVLASEAVLLDFERELVSLGNA